MSEWISVEDRLPPKHKADKEWSVPVLVYYYDKQDWMYVSAINFKDKLWYGDNSGANSNITHWMPLPESPNNEKN
jgi:hypothetical protein